MAVSLTLALDRIQSNNGSVPNPGIGVVHTLEIIYEIIMTFWETKKKKLLFTFSLSTSRGVFEIFQHFVPGLIWSLLEFVMVREYRKIAI